MFGVQEDVGLVLIEAVHDVFDLFAGHLPVGDFDAGVRKTVG